MKPDIKTHIDRQAEVARCARTFVRLIQSSENPETNYAEKWEAYLFPDELQAWEALRESVILMDGPNGA